ncbi:AAA family ATPase [Streptomyces sp. NBC_01422]|uniref:AAA family ATPase n=1 Tax=Streptomyces sp. NBC_01422 TaxID=2903859 RepID=UPI002E2C4EDC|nr:AAA family ATPase [Streptomyces sp. NBC_01422]
MATGFGQVDNNMPQAAQDLARQLQEVARGAGYSGVRELAADSGVGRSTVSDALTARRVPTWEKLSDLLRCCDVIPNRQWAVARETAQQAVNLERQAARSSVHEPAARETKSPAALTSPGTFSIRPPYGELPPRLRGRDALLAQLENSLAEGVRRPQVLCGLGGCGKTAVALQLARQARDRGYRVFWLSAATPEGATTGMREVARELGADNVAIEAAWSGRTSATDLVWGMLDRAEHPWLLVLDNADEPAWLAAPGATPGDGTGWLRSSRSGLTVVTTRVGSPEVWGREADTHRIDVLSAADGRDVLLDLAGESGGPAEALALAERLDGLPLALKLVGSHLARAARGAGLLRNRGRQPGGRLRSFAAYADALGEVGAELLDQGGHWRPEEYDTERAHRRLIGRTWELSLDLLEEQQLPEARILMRLLSCCAAAPFPVDLLDPDVLPDPSNADADRADQVDRAIEALVDLNLIDVVDIGPHNPDGTEEPTPCLVSHRLVLEVNALRLADAPPEERLAVWRATARLLDHGAARAPEPPANWPWWRLLAPHVTASLEAAPANDAEGADDALLMPLLRAGLAAYAFFNFSDLPASEMNAALARLLLSRTSSLPENHSVRLSVRHRFALSLLTGEEELREYEDILVRQTANQGPDHPETLITRYNVVVARRRHDRITDAEEEAELRAVLESRSRVLGPDDPYTILTHATVAQRMMVRGHGEEGSLDEYEALAENLGSRMPGDHRFLPLHQRHQLAHALDSAERWTEAETEYRGVLTALERYGAEGMANELYWDMLHCLCNNLIRQDRRPDAVDLLDASLPWFDDSRDSRSRTRPEALKLRHMRGDMLRRCNRPADAERDIRTVLADRLLSVDLRDSQVLSERHCLAHTLEDLERHGEAQDELREVAEEYTRILGVADSLARRAAYCLARMLHRNGLHAEALRWYEQTLAGETTALGAEHEEALMTRFRLDQCRHDLNMLSAAETAEAHALILVALEARLDRNHDWITVVREALGTISAQGKSS